MAPMDKITGVSLPCLMSDHDRWKSQSTTVSATDETWQILPADVKAAVKARTSLQLGQSSRSKKLSRLFIGHFWTKIRSENCFEIVLTYRMA